MAHTFKKIVNITKISAQKYNLKEIVHMSFRETSGPL